MQLAHENRRVWGWVGVSVRVSRLGTCPGATTRHGRGRFLKTQQDITQRQPVPSLNYP